MLKNKKLSRRISAFALILTLISLLSFATIVFGDTTTEADVTTVGEETTAPQTTEPATSTVYESVKVEDDGGLIKSILRFFGKILSFCNNITGNYIVALFIFSVLMQILLCFVGIKQQKNSVGQARLAPKVAAINKKYAGRNDQATLQKKQSETMELYQKEGFNPMGGCLPLLVQLPVIMILYYVVIAPMEYILDLSSSVATNLTHLIAAFDSTFVTTGRAVEMNVINWFRTHGSEGLETLRNFVSTNVAGVNAEAATNYNQSLDLFAEKMDNLPNFTIGKVDLAQVPSLTGNGSDVGKWLLLLIPVLTFVFLILTQKLTKKFTYQSPETQEAQNKLSMKIMTWSMPLLSTYFTFIVPAAIGVYWIFRNVLNLVQQIILAKLIPVPKYTEEDYKAAERELMGSSARKKDRATRNTDPNRPKVRSLHHIDDEGYENGYKIDPNEPAPAEKPSVGATTDVKDAPAPIKNDDKTSFTAKSSDDQ